jgi:hypothetical protein
MKMRLLHALAGLAIGFLVPALAEEKNTVDPEVRQQIEAVLMKHDEAYNKNDAAAIAALFTLNAVQVFGWDTGGGAVSGQQAIEKRYAVEFASTPSNMVSKLVRAYAIGDNVCAITEWSVMQWKGYAVTIYVRKLDEWKIRMAYADSIMIPR